MRASNDSPGCSANAIVGRRRSTLWEPQEPALPPPDIGVIRATTPGSWARTMTLDWLTDAAAGVLRDAPAHDARLTLWSSTTIHTDAAMVVANAASIAITTNGEIRFDPSCTQLLLFRSCGG